MHNENTYFREHAGRSGTSTEAEARVRLGRVPSLSAVSALAQASGSFSQTGPRALFGKLPPPSSSFPSSFGVRLPLADSSNTQLVNATSASDWKPFQKQSLTQGPQQPLDEEGPVISVALARNPDQGAGFPKFDPFQEANDPLVGASVSSFQRNKLVTVGDVVAQGSYHAKVSPHLVITNLKNDMNIRDIMRILETSGDIKITYPDFIYSSGTLSLTYYDVRDAMAAMHDLSALFASNPYRFPGVEVAYGTHSELSVMYGIPLGEVTPETSLIVALYGARERLRASNWKNVFNIWGQVRDVVEIEFSEVRRVLQVEFFDERAAAHFKADMNNQVYQGVMVQICDISKLALTPVGTPGVPYPASTASEVSAWTGPSTPRPVGSAYRRHHLESSFAPDEDVIMAPPSPNRDSGNYKYFGDSLTRSALERHGSAENMPQVPSFAIQNQHKERYTSSFSFFSCERPLGLVGQDTRFAQPQAASSKHSSPVTYRSSRYLLPPEQGAEQPSETLTAKESFATSPPSLLQQQYSSSVSLVKQPSVRPPQPLDNTFDIQRVIDGTDTRTTFMIRNIPNKYTQAMLKECIDATHKGTYDFLYLRIDFQNKCNVGYAFINFIDVRSVISFARERAGKRWNRFNSEKRCSLSYANIQGKQALIEKFRNSTVMEEDESYRPKIFYSSGPYIGEEEPFPPPTVLPDIRRHRQEARRRREASGSSSSGLASGSPVAPSPSRPPSGELFKYF